MTALALMTSPGGCMKKNDIHVVIRVDSSFIIGSGHIKRCLTLANALRQHDVNVAFVSREHEGSLIEYLEHENHLVYKLSPITQVNDSLSGYERWLGVTQEQDVRDTLTVLDGQRFDWMVVDHYGLDATWEHAARACADKIMVIDDLAERGHACDLLLDQNYFGVGTASRYEGLVPISAQVLLGPDFALLQPEYLQLRQMMVSQDEYVQRVVVYLGYANLGNQTNVVLEALSAPELKHLVVDVVTGIEGTALDELQKLARDRGRTVLHKPSPTLAGLMAKADLMIGAGGATTWERMCLGCPAVVVSLAENQQGFTEALQRDGYQVVVSSGLNTSSSEWKQTILSTINEIGLLKKLAYRSRELVDGLGVQRVVQVMCSDQLSPLTISGEVESPERFKLVGTCQYGLPTGEVHVELDRASSEASMNVVFAPNQSRFAKALLGSALDFWKKTNFCDAYASFFKKLNSPNESTLYKTLRVNLLSDEGTWLNTAIHDLQEQLLNKQIQVNWVHDPNHLLAGDVCFILSCSRILSAKALGLNKNNLVVHASALPAGRGWSPMTWQILEGKQEIPLTLFEAKEAVDTGLIYQQTVLQLDGSELVDEWREAQSKALVKLCMEWIKDYPNVLKFAREQEGEASYYAKRRPNDSELDPSKTIAEQFNLLRTVDNNNYPAYFYMHGYKYLISINKEL